MALLLRNRRSLTNLLAVCQKVSTDTAVVSGYFPQTQVQKLPYQNPQFRYFSEQTKKLVDKLSEEVKHEQESYEKPDVLAGGPPAPFVLQEKEIDTLLTLKRSYNNEEIEVDVKVNDQPEPETIEGEDGQQQVEINLIFTATVTKGDQSLIMDIRIMSDQFVIDHVALEPKEGFSSDSFYNGPVFDELDEDLVTGFYDFLDERGIGTELANYLVALVHDKEQREYQSWLQRVKAFVSS
eukprot:TRINITY_DN96689_c0_g1_i1.p2 TRINITY_DN96689_c0_g1~~TRINITY_DN96689_c0_g1_i1.p2  ORF type:complete len:238 (+),score=42.53 TRINITY_DN96689_c0_g1_i1:146-859(+)